MLKSPGECNRTYFRWVFQCPAPPISKISRFWPKFAPGVGGNGSSTLFHPQSARPEVGGPKSDQNGPNISQKCGHLWVFDPPPLKVDHHQPLKVDHHGGPCRIRSTFKGGCVLHGSLRGAPDRGAPGRGRGQRRIENLKSEISQPGRPQRGLADMIYTPTLKSRSNATRAPVVIYF